MPVNIEIKARSNRIPEIRNWLQQQGARFAGTDTQTDTYFRVPSGRLKLRQARITVAAPFGDTPGRRDVGERLSGWLAEELRWAEGRLTVGVDFALSLPETHLRQLGMLRQALKGPGALGKALEERFLTEAADYTDNLPEQCLHPVGHWFEIPNLLKNGVLARLLAGGAAGIAGEGRVAALLTQAKSFGFHLAALDGRRRRFAGVVRVVDPARPPSGTTAW